MIKKEGLKTGKNSFGFGRSKDGIKGKKGIGGYLPRRRRRGYWERRTFAQDLLYGLSVKTIKREPPINRASPRDYECLHLPR